MFTHIGDGEGRMMCYEPKENMMLSKVHFRGVLGGIYTPQNEGSDTGGNLVCYCEKSREITARNQKSGRKQITFPVVDVRILQ